jgi:hypothetical protein
MAKIAKAYLQELIEQGMSMVELTRKFNVPNYKIRKVCEEYGIEPPNQQGQRYKKDKWESVSAEIKNPDHDGMMALARAIIRTAIADTKSVLKAPSRG